MWLTNGLNDVDGEEVEGEMTDFDKTFDTTIEHDRNNVTDEIILFKNREFLHLMDHKQTEKNQDKQKRNMNNSNNNNKQIKFRIKYPKF